MAARSLLIVSACAVLFGCGDEPDPSHATTGDHAAGHGEETPERSTGQSERPAQVTLTGSSAQPEPAPRGPWFREITEQTGIDAKFVSGATGEFMTAEVIAGGIAIFDADGDGRPDIYVLNGNRHLPDTSVIVDDTPGAPHNRLFLNRGDFRFEEITKKSGLECHGYAMGVAVGDIDNDGTLDVYVSNLGPDRLFRNRGDGTFEDITESAGLGDGAWGASCLFVDINRSGFLDLYVSRYVHFVRKRCSDLAGRPEFCGPKEYAPLSDLLYRNNGNRTFTDISESAGMSSVRAAGLGVVSDDFDDDGWPDIYVANDAYANQLWINRQNERFTDMSLRMGCALNMFGEPEAGMGVVAADFNNNTRIDLFMTHLMNETNTLYVNHGGRRGFSDATAESGLGASSMAYTGFGVVAFDADHDGMLDIFVANGRVYYDAPSSRTTMPAPWNAYAEPNIMYRGRGGHRFDLLGEEVTELTDAVEITRGAIAADLDGNGRLDLVVANIDAPLRIYRNDAGRHGHWLMVTAFDPDLNRDAVGARIVVHTEGETRSRTIASATSYLSASPYDAHFGLGVHARYDFISIRWPDGSAETFPGGPSDIHIRLVRGEGSPSDRPAPDRPQ